MRVLALDLSKTSTGYALFVDGELADHGNLKNERSVKDEGAYPWNYIRAVNKSALLVEQTVNLLNPDKIVIEETNGSKSRYTQKMLEFLHLRVLQSIMGRNVVYLNTSDWRRTLGVGLTKDDKRQNAKLSRAKSKAKAGGYKLDKKKLGIRGRINKKHRAIQYANETFKLSLKVKDNDVADAICLGKAFLSGCAHATGE